MREIKFRAWEVLEDEEGNENWNMEYRGVQVSENGKHLSYGFEIDSSVLMQYTGLKDRNGVEIYEGDIVYLAGYGDYEVEFPFLQLYESSYENDIGEIKGNIHENPELLEQA